MIEFETYSGPVGSRFKDLTGRRFGKLTAVSRAPNKNGLVQWNCDCECGGRRVAYATHLTEAQTTSCGCGRVHDISGQRFGRLVAITRTGSDAFRNATWLCRCDCGATKGVPTNPLVSGGTLSCGCQGRDSRVAAQTKHGMHKSSEYRIWQSMIQRCHRPSSSNYVRYGQRGIAVCDRWRKSFEAFYADMGKRPRAHSIDRIDNSGNYEPGNCRWATQTQQCNNRRGNRILTALGRSMTVAEWSRELDIAEDVIRYRVRSGWDAERILGTPGRARGAGAPVSAQVTKHVGSRAPSQQEQAS